MPPSTAMPLDSFADIMLELALLLTMVLVARWLTSRFRQPGVLGELLVGVLLGNLGYWLGVPFFTFVMTSVSCTFSRRASCWRSWPWGRCCRWVRPPAGPG